MHHKYASDPRPPTYKAIIWTKIWAEYDPKWLKTRQIRQFGNHCCVHIFALYVGFGVSKRIPNVARFWRDTPNTSEKRCNRVCATLCGATGRTRMGLPLSTQLDCGTKFCCVWIILVIPDRAGQEPPLDAPTTLGRPGSPDPRNSSAEKFLRLRNPSVEGLSLIWLSLQGWSISSSGIPQEFIGWGIPRVRSSRASTGGEHPRVVLGPGPTRV